MLKKYGAVSLHTFMFIVPIAGVAMGGADFRRADYS